MKDMESNIDLLERYIEYYSMCPIHESEAERQDREEYLSYLYSKKSKIEKFLNVEFENQMFEI